MVNKISPPKLCAPSVSDGALAFRVHIAKESEAPRLMIWQKGDVWTFANVANKNDVRIDCAELEGAAL